MHVYWSHWLIYYVFVKWRPLAWLYAWPLAEWSLLVKRLLLASLDALHKKWWQVSKNIVQLILAFRYFLFPGNHFMKLNNKNLVDDLLILCHRLYYCKLSRSYTSCFCRYLALIEICSITLSLWYPAPVVICRKYCFSSTYSEGWSYKLVCLLDVISKKF